MRKRHSHIFEREANDWYIEPEWCSQRLFAVERFPGTLLDACAGTGRIAKAAKAAGYKVLAADIVDRGYRGCKVQDFLTRTTAPASIVCNPPFDIIKDFVQHALKLGATKVAMINEVKRLNAARWLNELPLRRVWLMTPRPSMPPGPYILAGGKAEGDTRDFCWLVFERGYRGRPEIRWLHRDPHMQPE
jgi:hypothetical protein